MALESSGPLQEYYFAAREEKKRGAYPFNGGRVEAGGKGKGIARHKVLQLWRYRFLEGWESHSSMNRKKETSKWETYTIPMQELGKLMLSGGGLSRFLGGIFALV